MSFAGCNLIRVAGALAVAAAIDTWPASPAIPTGSFDPLPAGNVARSYRIIGKLHLALFTIGNDDVGSARISWRSDGRGSSISLLVGSDPDHAPKRLNEWGYMREESGPDGAEVFVLRRATDEDQARPSAPRDDGLLVAGCASMVERDVRSFATTVDAPGTTYRTFDRLLDQLLDAPPKWNERHLVRPTDAQPGFLTALDLLLRGAGAATNAGAVAAVPYVYNGKVYDLSARRLRAIGPTTVGARAFEALNRADLSVRNRSTGEVSKLAVTYVPDRSHFCLPVQIFVQPNFWVSVELRQDDLADAPPDPADGGDAALRIKRICAAAAH